MDVIKNISTHGNHITAMLSMNDLIQLAGYTSVEYCGGPSMVFRMGRKDYEESEVSSVATMTPSHENSV